MNEAGFDCETMEMDLSSRESIKAIITKAQEYGDIKMSSDLFKNENGNGNKSDYT